MNIRELSIYIRNYFVNTYYYKMTSIIVISTVGFLGFVVVHYIKHRTLNNSSLKSWIAKVIFAIEIATLVSTMLIRGTGISERQWRIQPFASYFLMIESKSMGTLSQIIMNIVVYIPFGFLLPYCFEFFKKGRYAVLMAFLCSGCIEVIQGVTKIGLFEVDDIIHNVLGAVIGVGIYKLCTSKRNKDVGDNE